nr:neuroblast differentiation-associated protein AHNAK isoform X2 [Paramormyrops kingsleyae]
MAEGEDTREVLFPNWMGADEQGLTIERTGQGEILVKEVKVESAAARTGRVYEGDQIVGATIYFDNMSSDEAAELLKTLNRHKVGLKLQNRPGEKSPCRSPVGTLSWEGRGRIGSSSPDVILSGDDEDYRRIYTKKIKPRLKSEDLAEEVDVRTERHSSTSSDGNTITTITRRITTYTVDVPGEASQQEIDLSSPEFKIKVPRHDQPGDDGSYTTHVLGPQISFGASGSSEKKWTMGSVKTTGEIREGEREEVRFKVPGFGISGSREEFSVSGQRLVGDSSISAPGINIEKGVSASDEELRGRVKVSSFGITGQSTEGKLNTDMTGSIIKGMKTQTIDINVPDIDRQSDKVGIKLPAFGFKSRDVATSGIIDTKGSKGEIGLQSFSGKGTETAGLGFDVKGPNIDITPQPKGDITTAKIDIKAKDIKSSKGDVNIKIPGMGMKITSPEIKEPKMTGVLDFTRADINTNSRADIKGPHLDILQQESTVRIPSISGSTISTIGADACLKGQTLKKDTEMSISQIEGGIRLPNVGAPELNVNVPDSNFKETKMKISAPSVSLFKAEADHKGSKLDIEDHEFHVKGPDGQIEGPKIKMPFIYGQKSSMPDVDISVKGRQVKGEISGSVPKVEGGIREQHVKVEGMDVKIEGSEGGIKMPKMKVPSFGMKEFNEGGSSIDMNVPGVDIDIGRPKIDLKGSKFGIEGYDGKITMPTISGPKVSMPDMDLTLKGPKLKGDMDVSVPKVECDIKAPKVDIEGPDVEMEGPGGGFKMPKMKMHKFDLKGPKVEGPDVDVNLPKGNIDVKAPKIDIEGPDVDIERPDGKIKGSTFKMPSISGPKISMPDVDWNLKGSKLKGDMDVSVAKVEGDIRAPKVDIEGPDVQVEGPEGGFKMPKIHMPKFGFKGPKVEGPDVDVNLAKADVDIKGPEVDIEGPHGKVKGPKFTIPTISGPKISMPDMDLNLKGPKLKGDMDVSVTKLEGDIKAPKVDIEGPDVQMEGPEGGFKMPKIHMPKFGFKGPKVEGPGVDVNLPKADFDIKGHKVDIEGPEFDVEGPDGKIKGPKLKMPAISGPKISMPDVDFNLKGPKLKGDMDVSVPKVQGDIKAPKADIEGPDVDIEGPEGGFKMPKIKMPKFGLKGPKLEGPDVDVNLPKANVDIKGPEIDIEGPDGKIKGPKFAIPTISGPKISMPDVDFNLKGPKLKGDMDVSVPKVEGDIKVPRVDIEGPDVHMEGPEGGFKMPKIHMPKFGFKGPKVEGPDVDVNLPKADLELKGPKVDIEGPEFDVEGPDGKIKGPKFKMPKISGPNISMPDVDFNLKGPKLKGDMDASLPKVEGEIKAPKVDIEGPDVDIEGPEGGFKMPKIKMPKFGLKGPKVEGPDVDVNLPKADFDLKGPKVDIEGPEFDVEGPDGKIKGPKFKMPKISGPNINLPDFNLKGPKIEGDLKGPKVDISAPEVDIGAPDFNIKGGKVKGPKIEMPKLSGPNIKIPDVDFNLKGPTVEGGIKGPEVNFEGPDVQGPEAGIKLPKIKMPKFGVKGPKFEGPEVDVGMKTDVKLPEADVSLDLPDTDVNIKGKKSKFKMPKIKGKVKKPDVDIGLKSPDIDLETHSPDIHVKGPKVKKPLFGMLHFPDLELDIKSPKIKGDGTVSDSLKTPNMDLPSAGVKADIKTPVVDIPDVNVEGPDVKMKKSKIKMPKFNISGPKLKTPDIDIKGPGLHAPDVNVCVPDVDVKGPDMKAKLNLEGPEGKLKGPSLNIETSKIAAPDLSLKGTKVKGDLDISGEIKGPSVEGPDINLEGPDGKMKGPTFKIPTVDIKAPKISGPEFDLKKPKIKGDIDVSSEIKGPKVNVEGPDVEFVGLDGKAKGPTVKMPTISGPGISVPDVDLKLKGPKVKGDVDMPLPAVRGDVKSPKVEIEGPAIDTEGGFKIPKIKMPKFALKGPNVESPNVDINLKTADIGIKGPEVDIEGPGLHVEGPEGNIKGPKLKMPSTSVSMPGVDFNLKAPKVSEGDLNVKAEAGEHAEMSSVTIPKIKVPKFGIALPKLEGPEVGVDIGSGGAVGGGSVSMQASGASTTLSSQSLELEGPEVKTGGGKTKVKLPKLFGKSKSKGGSAADLSLQGPSVEVSGSGGGVKGSKGLSVSSGELPGKSAIEGGPGISVSPKTKSASLDLFKKSRHRSSSLSDEGGLASPSSPSGHLQAEGGASLEGGEVKVKGKKGKLKFGTFGGFGSKSKGSYEVSLGEEAEAQVEGSGGVSLPSKKSRVSSSSSGDSAAKGGFRFPRVELSVSPKK